VVEERMRKATGRVYSHKNSAPVTPHGMYFPSTPLPSLLSLLLSEKDMVGRYRGCMKRQGELVLTRVHLEG